MSRTRKHPVRRGFKPKPGDVLRVQDPDGGVRSVSVWAVRPKHKGKRR